MWLPLGDKPSCSCCGAGCADDDGNNDGGGKSWCEFAIVPALGVCGVGERSVFALVMILAAAAGVVNADADALAV